MTTSAVTRRTPLRHGGAVIAGLSVLRLTGPAHAFQDASGGEVIPWIDQPDDNPVPEVIVQQLEWEGLDDWLTPTDEFFVIKHFNLPELDEADWRFAIDGLVTTPLTLTLTDLKSRARQKVTFTMECSGNSGLPFFTGGVGNAAWAGTPLAALLDEAGIEDDGREVVFWGADAGEQTWREVKITEEFARSMSLEDARSPDNLLVYEMNGDPLPPLHGFPLRLIAPDWYGIANVKWLTRIEVRDARYQGHFMARDYITIREEVQDGESAWTFTSVGRARLKSAPAKVTKRADGYQIMGAAWGSPVSGVEVRIDDGDWCGRGLRLGLLDARLGHADAGRAHRHLTGDRHRRRGPAGGGRPLPGRQDDVLGEQRPDHPPRPHCLTHRAGAGCPPLSRASARPIAVKRPAGGTQASVRASTHLAVR